MGSVHDRPPFWCGALFIKLSVAAAVQAKTMHVHMSEPSGVIEVFDHSHFKLLELLKVRQSVFLRPSQESSTRERNVDPV
jgi:hypothetical protein